MQRLGGGRGSFRSLGQRNAYSSNGVMEIMQHGIYSLEVPEMSDFFTNPPQYGQKPDWLERG